MDKAAGLTIFDLISIRNKNILLFKLKLVCSFENNLQVLIHFSCGKITINREKNNAKECSKRQFVFNHNIIVVSGLFAHLFSNFQFKWHFSEFSISLKFDQYNR